MLGEEETARTPGVLGNQRIDDAPEDRRGSDELAIAEVKLNSRFSEGGVAGVTRRVSMAEFASVSEVPWRGDPHMPLIAAHSGDP